MQRLLDWFDRLTQRGVRQVAHRHGRRSLVTRLGVAMVGGAVLPMLPTSTGHNRCSDSGSPSNCRNARQ